MLSVQTGHSAQYLTGAVGAGREDYYAGAVAEGEPPGRWRGKGAAALGLVGEVDEDVMHELFSRFADPRDPLFADPDTRSEAGVLGRAPKRYRTPEQVVSAQIEVYSKEHASTPSPEQIQAWQIDAERNASKAVPFYDLTFSPPKSITVLWAAFSRAAYEAREAGDVAEADRMAAKADLIESAVEAANDVMLEHIESQVVSRTGRHGGKGATGRWIDAQALIVASFPQHTSRERDPQLHTHNAVLNQVECTDGVYRAIHGKVLYGLKHGAGAIASMELREHLTRELGVGWVIREDGHDFEIAGIEQHEMDLLSSRSRTSTAKADQLIAAFEEHHNRAATSWERDRLRQQAVLATRPAKSHDGETTAEMLDRADAVMRTESAGGLLRVAARFDRPADEIRPAAQGWSPEAVIAQAIEACHGEGGKSTFRASELSRRIALALPPHLGLAESGQARDLVEQLTQQALASDLLVQTSGLEVGHAPNADRLASGRAATIAPEAVRYAARGHVAAETALLRASGVRGRTAVDRHVIAGWLEQAGSSLSPAQRAAVAGLASSDAALAVLIGPAGTGKSYTVGRLADAWADLTGGRVIGVATAQVAADVLRDDGLPDAANVAAFLAAHARIGEGRPLDVDERWRLSAGDVLVVDEASMVDTASLTKLQAVVASAGARMILMGDPRQLGAVGAGGMMRTVAESGAEVHTLSEVRRFTSEWERAASLALRDGDASVVAEYDRHGRIVDGGTETATVAAIARAAAADRIAGRDTLVVAGSNALAGQVSAAVRRHLVDVGLVTEDGVILGRDRCTAGVGDVVQARKIDRDPDVVNRETYRVTDVLDDGGLQVVSTRTGTEHTLTPDYVATDVSLAYASTAHAAEGATVTTGHLLLTPGMSTSAAYVGLSRGTDNNTVWAVTDTGIPDKPVQTGRGLLAGIVAAEQDVAELSALDVTDADTTRRASAATILGLVEDKARAACRTRLDADLDQLVTDGALTEWERARFGSDQGSEHLARQLRAIEQAGLDAVEVLRKAVTNRSLTSAVSVAQAVADRIDRTHGLPVPEPTVAAPSRVSEVDAQYLAELGSLLDERRAVLGQRAAEDLPGWALATLGPVPAEADARAGWERSAGIIAAQREATGWTSDEHALGRCPGIHSPEKRADWHAAYLAAGQPEHRRPEAEMTEGRLLVRVAAAQRVLARAPAFVDPQMRARNLAAQTAARDAILARAQGRDDDAARLDAEAAAHAEAAARLAEIADERGGYLAREAETIAAGQASREELERRGKTPGTEKDRTSAAEWLAAEHDARRADDAHRIITEADLLDHQTETAATDDAVREQSSAEARRSSSATRDKPAPTPELAVTVDRGAPVEDLLARKAPAMSAEAAEAEIRAAAAHAEALAAEAVDAASLDTHEPTDTADEDWYWQHELAATNAAELDPSDDYTADSNEVAGG